MEDRRRASVGLVKWGSVSDVFAGDSSLLAKVLGRLQSVEASLVSLTNSDGERAAEDVEERLQAIEASLAASKPTLDERRRSAQVFVRRVDSTCARVKLFTSAPVVIAHLRQWWSAASHLQTAVAAAETLRRHIRTLLLRQQRRCGVALVDCCCGSRDVAASHSQTAVAAAETLQRRTLRPLLWQQRRCGVTLAHCCCGNRDVAASGITAETAVEPAYFAMVGGKLVQPGCSIVQACSSSLLMLGENVAVDFLSGRLSVDGRIYAESAPQMERCVWRVSSL